MAVPERIPSPIGARRLRVTIERPVETPDGAGGVTRAYSAAGAARAALSAVSATERWQAGRPEQAVTHRAELRWRAGLDAGCRLRRDARVFDVRAAYDPDGSRRRLVCLIEEVTP